MQQHGWTLRDYAKWSKPESKRQIPHGITCGITYMWHLKNKKVKLIKEVLETTRKVVASGWGVGEIGRGW